MKSLFQISVFIFCFMALIVGNVSAQNTDQKKDEQKVFHIPAVQMSEFLMFQEGVILDIRTPKEFKEGHIPKAINSDYYETEAFKKTLKSLDCNEVVYMYCRSGGRSSKAVQIMLEMGFTKIYHIKDGFQAYEADGNMPIEK